MTTRATPVPTRSVLEAEEAPDPAPGAVHGRAPAAPAAPDPDPGPGHPLTDTVMGARRRLLNLAYRLLGSLTEAEDAVQEAYARWYAMGPGQREAIVSPGAWLTTVTGRVCLTVLGSARVRRETYVGEWLPEPLPDRGRWSSVRAAGGTGDPADAITLDESVDLAFLVVLESMTPAERVAFVLHDVFCHSFAEVAQVLGRTPAACRQLASSGRRRVRNARPSAAPAARHSAVVREFERAWQAKDIGALIGLLDPGATATADGGGRALAFLHPIVGGERIAQAWVDIAGRRPAGMTFAQRTVGGRPGLVAEQDGAVVTVFAFDVAGDGWIRHIWVMRNPDKLRGWRAA